ncbi:hypothetical protein MRB53_026274 [Persea americana]|uniref:Uncharacterized protein n=1 Tax=Persea americana TaxID=3435 RepID=A0ACC2LIH8_PERAE|nr:hypothetical protein MRB53_026274 [Persea americana]
MNRSGRGIKQDEYGFTYVDITWTLNTNEPFVLANQARQIFYVEDTIETNWHTVDTIDDVITWSRPNIEVVVIDAKMILPHQSQEHEGDDAFIDDGDGEDTATDDGSCNGQKRTRRRTRGIKLFNRRPGDKLIIQFNVEGQPTGENAKSFSTLSGIVVRSPSNAPLQVKKWARILEQAKEKMWSHIQVNGDGTRASGRVRGYGLGPTPTSNFGSTSSQSRANYETMRTEFNNMYHQVEEMKMMQERMSATMEEMMQQMSSQQQDPFESRADE